MSCVWRQRENSAALPLECRESKRQPALPLWTVWPVCTTVAGLQHAAGCTCTLEGWRYLGSASRMLRYHLPVCAACFSKNHSSQNIFSCLSFVLSKLYREVCISSQNICCHPIQIDLRLLLIISPLPWSLKYHILLRNIWFQSLRYYFVWLIAQNSILYSVYYFNWLKPCINHTHEAVILGWKE